MKKTTLLLVPVALIVLCASSAFSADSKAGKTIYDKSCKGCHAADGKGTKMGKPVNKFDAAKYKKAILKGIKPKMPAYEKKLKAPDVDNLLEFLKSLSK